MLNRFCHLLYKKASLAAIVTFLPILGFCQVTITGSVLNITDTKPIAAASVFLSNTTIGSESGKNGYFALGDVKPGKYDLVVSVVGFDTYEQSITVGNSDIKLPPISLVSRTINLNVVRIKPDNKWFRLYKHFKEEFFGALPYASECKILNPDSLDLNYDDGTRQLTASSRGFLIIENGALGYRIKYLLKIFDKDYGKSSLAYKGLTIFTEMKGTAADQKRWAKNRLDCYRGSVMHFLRSTIAFKTASEGFEVYPMRRKEDPNKMNVARTGIKYKYVFIDSVLDAGLYAKRTNLDGIYLISRPLLYVIYKNRIDYGLAPIYNQVNMPNWQSSVVALRDDYALFDQNGVLVDPLSVSYDGYWTFMRVAEQLPVNYEPK